MTVKGLTPWMQQKVEALLAYAQSVGIDAKLGPGKSAFRTCEDQNAILAGGEGTATTVGGCHSWHVWGRAVDLRIPGDRRSDYATLGAEWKRWGGIWGGDWVTPNDPGHYEWHPDVPDIHDLCPRGAGLEYCPDPGEPWPDDRPMLERPLVKLAGGLILAGGGMYLAWRLARV